MADYTLRNTKGSELTFGEVDNNFIASRTTARANGCNLITPPSGFWINQQWIAEDLTSVNAQVTTVVLTPFLLGYDLEIDRWGVWQISSNNIDVQFLIYSANSEGKPSSRLAASSVIATGAAAGAKEEAVSFTFTANTLYWVGVHASSNESFRAIQKRSLKPLGLGTGLGTTAGLCSIRLASTNVGSAPATWSFDVNQLSNPTGVIALNFRAA